MTLGRSGHTAKLLKNGTVLIVGGWTGRDASRRTAEIYDPETGTFSLTGTMSEPRGQHTATILKNGRVLLAGGGSGDYPSRTFYRSADLYDPATGKFTPTGQMTECRHKSRSHFLAKR